MRQPLPLDMSTIRHVRHRIKKLRFRARIIAYVSCLFLVLLTLLLTGLYASKSEAASSNTKYDSSAYIEDSEDSLMLFQYTDEPTDPPTDWPTEPTDSPTQPPRRNSDIGDRENRDDEDDNTSSQPPAPVAQPQQDSQQEGGGQALTENAAPTGVATPPRSLLPALPQTGDCILATKTNQGVNVRAEPSVDSGVTSFLQVPARPGIISQTTNEAGEIWYQIEQGWVAALVVRVGGDCTALAEEAGESQIEVMRDGHEELLETVQVTFSVWEGEDGKADVFMLVDGDVTQLTESARENELLPVASPTGAWVAYLSQDSSGEVSVRLVHTVNHSTLVVLEGSAEYSIPLYPFTWSADGAALFVTLVDADGVKGVYRVEIGNAMSIPAPELLIANAAMPVYSSNGEYLAFQQVDVGTLHISALIQSNGITTVLTQQLRGAFCYSPTFGADGETVFFLCDEGSRTQLYRYDSAGLQAVNVDVPAQSTFVQATDGYLLFTDGTTLYLMPEAGGDAFPILRSDQQIVTMRDMDTM
jgi:hypothetical protein